MRDRFNRHNKLVSSAMIRERLPLAPNHCFVVISLFCTFGLFRCCNSLLVVGIGFDLSYAGRTFAGRVAREIVQPGFPPASVDCK